MHESTQPCSLWRRLMAMLYDSVAIAALLILAALLPMVVGLGNQSAGKDPIYTLYLCLVCFLYFGWNWHRGGMTLGMRAWRVRILTDDNELPGWGRSFARFILSLVSAACVGLGFVWALIDAKKRCWHDMGTGTRLVWLPRPRNSD